MAVALRIRNESTRKQFYRSDTLTRLLDRILAGEGVNEDVEVSLLFCDDPFIQNLNRQYRRKNKPTDVLSFEQESVDGDGPRALGDIVVSLETVETNCHGERAAMREEVRMLVCHGALHLLGYDHGTKREQGEMLARQAAYLGVSQEDAWKFGPKAASSRGAKTSHGR